MPGIKDTKPIQKLPSLTLGIMISGIALVTLISVFILLPQFLKIKDLKETGLKKLITLEHQKALFPVYANANKITELEFKTKLPIVERKPLKRDKITSLTQIFKQMAIKHHLAFSGNSLDISTLNSLTDHIAIELSLSGDLFNFRNYLISLTELNFFNSIEKIKILADQNKTKQFIAKIIIDIDKK